ncbi:eukaryotic integral membrane protein-domain-containing protein [Chytridium lagenaria]|nr:eukaryotic integral membrane protein-domain-containing protein [Chytridium lagenaria]
MNIAQALRNIPQWTRACLLGVVSMYIVSLLSTRLFGIQSLLTLYPGLLFWRLWAIITAGFVETNIFLLFINGTIFALSARYFEQIWGSKEFLTFVGVVNVSSVVLTTITLFFSYAVTQNEAYIFEYEIAGLAALISGFAVAFKQTVPEHSITLFKAFSIRVKYIPSILIMNAFQLYIFGFIVSTFYLILFGSASAWVYIRFYRLQDGIKGDRSETFAFASFFPEKLHPFVNPVSTFIFNFLVAFKLCPPLATSSTNDDDLESAPTPKTSSSDVADAERRRAIALKALDMRLQSNAQQASSSNSIIQEQPDASSK